MARDVLWRALAEVPWAELTRLAATALLCWLTWLLSKAHYAREWERWAPQKALDALTEVRRERDRERRRVARLEAQLATARGQIAAARARLGEMQPLELVEGGVGMKKPELRTGPIVWEPVWPPEGTVLEEAGRVVYGPREEDYSPPQRDYAKTARIWTGLLLEKLRPDCEITPLEAVLMMAGMKMAREVYKHKRDNLVDVCGYLACAERIVEGK